jgi:phosphatidylglycerophosphate synthase
MTSILASAERRCLIWIAGRLPKSITPDHLTVLALGAMMTAGLSYWAARFNRYWLGGAVLSLAVNWFGDSLDGTLARVRHQERPRYGFYVDHMVDCAGVLFLWGGLAASGFMNPVIALAVLVAYLLLSIEIYLATYCLAEFRLSFWGLGPTELRVLLAIGTLALLDDPTVDLPGHSVRLFDFGGVIAAAIMAATVLVSVARNGRALYQAERWRSETPATAF